MILPSSWLAIYHKYHRIDPKSTHFTFTFSLLLVVLTCSNAKIIFIMHRFLVKGLNMRDTPTINGVQTTKS